MSAGLARPDEDTDDEEFGGITELEKIAPDRVDGVRRPASGLPILLLKALSDQTDTGGAAMTATATETPATAEEVTVAKEDDSTPLNGVPPATPAPATAAKDGGDGDDDDDEDDGAPGEDLDGSGDSHGDPHDDAKKAQPTAQDRAAWRTALREHDANEPTTKGALDGTDVLKARSEWERWNRLGKAEGLDGTEAGFGRWFAKQAAEAEPPAASPAEDEVLKAVMAAEAPIYKRDIDTATRRRLAAEGHALPNLSYPIENAGDLDNAAHLARTGHGDVDAARHLIARRAKDLGVPDPLAGDADAKKAGDGDGDSGDIPKGMVKCPTCKGSKTIHDGGMTCPKCKGKGYVKPGKKARKAIFDATVTTLEKTVAAGLITRDAADTLIAEARDAAGLEKANPPLPADTKPVAEHREPDGPYVEGLEHDAHLPTDHDGTTGHIPDSVGKSEPAPYGVQRMHDALCAAYPATAVLGDYPALKSVTDAVEATWFTSEAHAALTAGEAQKAASLASLAHLTGVLKGYDTAAVDDARALLHKSFTDMYPDKKFTPGSPPAPRSIQRPYLSAGHAAENSARNGSDNIPPSASVPEPQQFERGYLSGGHAAPSPADHGSNNPNPPDAGGRAYYTTSEKDMAGAAMRSIHDHIASTFAGACPMAPSRSVMPSEMGATSTPRPKPPMSMGGIPTVGKAAGPDAGVPAMPPAMPQAPMGKRKKKKGMGRKAVAAALAQAAQAGAAAALKATPGPAPDTATLASVVAEQLKGISDRYDTQLATLSKQVDELGSQPDPALAPVRGQMARPGAGEAAPVEKRSLIDEATEARRAAAATDRERYLAYLQTRAQSADPKERLRAEALLEKEASRP